MHLVQFWQETDHAGKKHINCFKGNKRYLHSICKNDTCDQCGEGGNKCAGEGVASFTDLCSHKIHAHCIKNCFGAGK